MENKHYGKYSEQAEATGVQVQVIPDRSMNAVTAPGNASQPIAQVDITPDKDSNIPTEISSKCLLFIQ